MSFKLPTSIHSQDQLQFCAEELHAHAAVLRSKAATHHAAANPQGHPPDELSLDSQILIELLVADKRADAAAIEALATELEAMLAHGARVTITLAALASRALRTELVEWMRMNLKANLLVDFHVNPDIAGGIVIRTTNRVYDFSFRHQLLADTKRFTKALDHV
ncbi:MAG TPA: F0F1 ATP synthase subunit delta [Candidatus Saccharimonadales bacterium]|nr:F0F1 ATP synthase subunit delta [Candidatus Saccharimonadales bacterium]